MWHRNVFRKWLDANTAISLDILALVRAGIGQEEDILSPRRKINTFLIGGYWH